MGAQRTDQGDQDPGVSFQLGPDKVHVLILKPEDLALRNTILDTVLNLSALKYTYSLVYLAAPRLFGASVDATLFRTHGIGLLLYDERRIDEAVPAQPMQTGQAVRITQQSDKSVLTELATLKTMYLDMQRTISQLRDDLTAAHNLHTVREQIGRISVPIDVITAPDSYDHDPPRGGILPSYFANNPWLDVLSKRGNGEREPIAG